MNLLNAFLENVERHPERTAIIDGQGRAVTYGALAQRSARLAALWKRAGVRRGDRILLALPVNTDLYAAIAGLWRLGAVIVFPEPAMGYQGLRHAVRLARPRGLLSDGWYRLARLAVPELWRVPLSLYLTEGAGEGKGKGKGKGKGDELADVGSDHPALISFTSGSTGVPKGIERSHGFLLAQDACVADFLAPEDDRAVDLVAFPVFVIANLGLGVTSVLPDWPLRRAERATAQGIADLTARHRINRALVPPFICEVMAEGPPLPRLREIFTGGGPVFPDLLERLQTRLPKTELCTVYGSTEAEPIAWQRVSGILVDDWQRMKNGGGLLAGSPIPQIGLQLTDDEILVTGVHVNKSYLEGRGDHENKLRQEGRIWHRTGDAGTLDDKGRLWLWGRRAAGAGALYPFMAEAGARFWPGVQKAALLSGSSPILAIEGDRDQLDTWRRKAAGIGDLQVKWIDHIPVDRRHRSKTDLAALRRKLK